MTQTALPAPAAPVRRRAFFGLFDADGWGWATTKALGWFVLIIVLLGYIPDRAYYFTVQRTIDLGVLAWSPVNLCPPENRDLPCPVPVGAPLPWQPSPGELQLPAARADGRAVALGSTYLYLGGTDGSAATATVFRSAAVGLGNLDRWSEAPAMPAPRVDPAVVAVGSTAWVIGGYDAAGRPTSTVWSITADATGTLGEWTDHPDLALPAPRAGAAAVALADGIALLGGTDGTGPTDSVWRAVADAQGKLGAWAPQSSLYEPNVDGVGVRVGDVIYLVGGRNAEGPVATVQQGLVGGEGAPEEDPGAIAALWRVSEATNLPAPRTNATGFAASGVIYVIGGSDGSATQNDVFWAVPDAEGVIPAWRHLDQSDLGEGIEGSSAFAAGAEAFTVGGTTASGPTTGAARASLAPQAPIFQLGILGATVPALQLEGEIGQQIGYLNAAGVGTVNFIIVILLGWAFNHKPQVRAWLARRRAARA